MLQCQLWVYCQVCLSPNLCCLSTRSQRLQFDVSSPNGILLFRETSKMITTYGECAGGSGQPCSALECSACSGREGWGPCQLRQPGLGSSASLLAECMLRYREMLLLEVLGRQASSRAGCLPWKMRKKMPARSRSPAEPLVSVQGDMGEPVLLLSCFHSKVTCGHVLPWLLEEPH